MSLETELEDLNLCRAYLLTQLEGSRRAPGFVARRPQPGPAITISSQAGTGVHELAKQLAGTLGKAEPKGTCAWTVFDRQLIERVLEEHHLPNALAPLIPEERRSYIKDVMEELVGLRPPSWVIVPQVAETILHLAEVGRVIVVDHGASLITARMPNVFHVRLVASLSKRVEYVQARENLSSEDAERLVRKEDRDRQRYVKANFRARVDDDLLYHLVVNTGLVPREDAAPLIADAARRCLKSGDNGQKISR
jgi:Cytidylate kinase-like family